MWLKWILSAFILLSLTYEVRETEAGKLAGILDAVNFRHRAVLDQSGDFVMLWTPLEKEIHIEIQVATRGYIGIGFSPTGGMKGADIVLAWVDDQTGELHVHDRYAPGMMIPMIDESQDINVVGGYQNDTHTVVRFSREWNTCDSVHDFKLSGDTTRIIWSYSMKDPKGKMDMGIHDFRGTKSIYLREPRFQLPEFKEDVKSVDFLASNVTLPDNLDTLYWCQIYKFPDIKTKHQMVGYVPVIKEGNFKHVHHILLNECHLNDSSVHYEQWLEAGGRQCLTPNMPLSWKFCQHTIIAWAIGNEGEIYPEHVGMPLGEEYGGSNYYLMQTHYDNPTLRKGVVDNSGLRVFYTDNLREMDAGVVMVGHGVTSTMLIPPQQKWKTTGMCSGECTANNFPEDGIRVFQGLLHAHLLGRALTFRQIRNGREMPIVLKDMNYDFNYQQQRILREEMVILPGDTLIIECDYDSTGIRKPSFGGESTQEEMCLTYLTYYPRTDLSACLSTPELPNIYKPLGINELYQKETKYKKIFGSSDVSAEEIKSRDQKFLKDPSSEYEDFNFSFMLKKFQVKNPVEYQNKTLYDILHYDDTWKNPKALDELQKQVTYGTHSQLCQNVKGKPTEGVPDTTRFPDYVKVETLGDAECADSHLSEIYLTHEDEDEHDHQHDHKHDHEHDEQHDHKEHVEQHDHKEHDAQHDHEHDEQHDHKEHQVTKTTTAGAGSVLTTTSLYAVILVLSAFQACLT